MTYLLLQTFLLLLSSYFFGALVACLAKRAMQTASPGMSATASTATAIPAKSRDTAPAIAVGPRAFDPVQPKIDVLSRPEPKAAPPVADTSRFDRALGTALSASANVPRKAVVEIRPAVLKSPTRPAVTPVANPAPAAPAKAALATAVKPAAVAPAQPVKATPAPPVQPARPSTPAPVQAAPQPAPQQQSVPQAAASAAAAAAAAVAAAKAAAAAVTTAAPVKASPPPPPAPMPPARSETAAPAAVQSAPLKPAPVATAAVPVAPPPAATKPAATGLVGDDFQRIRAIDEDTERRLKNGGVTRFEEMARWTPSEVTTINEALDLNGRIDREQWVEQAQILAKGGETYYSRNRSQNPRSADATQTPTPPPRPATPSAPASPPLSASASVGQSAPQMSTSSSATQAAAAAAAAAATIRSNQPAPHATPPPAAAKVASEPTAKSAPAPAASANPPQRSVSEMASAAAIAIAAASASVTRGMRPIEPISPLSKVDPNQSRPARLQDAIKEQETKSPPTTGQASGQSSGPAFPLSGAATPSVGRDFNHLRSVRSEALRSAEFDDLKRIRGVGVLIEKRLNTLGVTSYDQIANWTNADIDRVSQTLDFKGRIERENWVEQARILSSGGHTEFSRRVDRGDVDSGRGS